MPIRIQIQAKGVVQGIGFRPLVYRLANQLALTGFVHNSSNGVVIEIQGSREDLDSFLARLKGELPPGGILNQITVSPISPVELEREFLIRESERTTSVSTTLAPDRYVCDQCLNEMRDPKNRRFKYPFINCTNCGPRYTITKKLPYDRPFTTMSVFEMCADCLFEYQDPMNRRYHAQPIACPVCGPHCQLVFPDSTEPIEGDARSITKTSQMLREGYLLAIKGIGGFHLAVDAFNARAVKRLRHIKKRPRKPLAVMAKELVSARNLVVLDQTAEDLLLSPAAPIVIAKAKEDSKVLSSVAPGLEEIGVMLPYSPLHHLLFVDCPEALVMTSGNRWSEPITKDNDEVLERLEVDAVLLHNRDIEVANDDSVIRSVSSGPVFLRRSRGYVPESCDVSFLPSVSVIGLGAELKVTLSAINMSELVTGRHLGNLSSVRTCEVFESEVKRVLEFASMEPEAVAVDFHPDLFSTEFAEKEFGGLPIIRVQHHHAHLAAVMVEHGLNPEDTVTGIILDGMGLGTDGTVWGGEVLVGGYANFKRFGYLRPIPMPGGDQASKEPHRMATSMIIDAQGNTSFPCFDEEVAQIAHIRKVSPLTSSAGRLFDGVAALLGIAPAIQDYEGEAATLLETIADPACDDAYEVPCVDNIVDTRALTVQISEDKDHISTRAARFHNGLADALAALALNAGQERVVLGGGCMANGLLVRRLEKKLELGGVKVLGTGRFPPGDGGLSVGQVASAACRLK